MLDRQNNILLLIAGLGGAIGTTLASGLAIPNNESELGLMTEIPLIKSLGIEFITSKNITIGGWDINQKNLFDIASELKIVPYERLVQSKRYLSSIKPRPGITRKHNLKEWFDIEIKQLNILIEQTQSDQVIVLNLLPTEPSYLQVNKDVNWGDFHSISLETDGITLSRLYFKLAIELGAHYINFTPNNAETIQLQKQAISKNLIFCGRDGKSGQTFLKTVLAPAFYQRNFKINGWYSTNLLGNKDGLALADPVIFETKRQSKSKCLEDIIGYAPGGEEASYGHQVHIHYYPPRKDAKESWDNIDFSGYLGEEMQLKLNWLGKDSILAAPMAYDLIRIVEFSSRFGVKGIIEETGVFFKTPLSKSKYPIHSFPAQFENLFKYLKKLKLNENTSIHKDWLDILKISPQASQTGVYLHASENMLPYSARLAQALEAIERYSLKPHEKFEDNDIYFANNIPLQKVKQNLINKFQEVLSSSWVNISALSGLHATEICINSFVKSDDDVFIVSPKYGGHPSMEPLLKNMNVNVHFVPFLENQLIDVNKLKEMIDSIKPILIVFDISDSLREQNLDCIKDIKGKSIILFDVSQTLGLIIGKSLTNPLNKGVDIIMGTTHKTFPGPHKAIIASNDKKIAEKIENIISIKVSSDHTDHILSLNAALDEFIPIAKEFAEQCKVNIQLFAKLLKTYNINVIDNVPLDTHQIWITFSQPEEAKKAYLDLEKSGIFTNLRKLPFNYGWGLRIGLHEITLRGFKEEDIEQLAKLFSKVIREKEEPLEVRDSVIKLIENLDPLLETMTPLTELLEKHLLGE